MAVAWQKTFATFVQNREQLSLHAVKAHQQYADAPQRLVVRVVTFSHAS